MDKIEKGLKYIKAQLDYTVPQHIPIAERWREGRFAFIAAINSPYIFTLIKINENIVSVICWVTIIAISVKILFDKDKDNENHIDLSTDALLFFYDANHEGYSLDKNQQEKVDEWYERIVLNKEYYYKATKFSERQEKRDKYRKKFKLWRNIAVCTLGIAILNKIAEYLVSMEKIMPKWLTWLALF